MKLPAFFTLLVLLLPTVAVPIPMMSLLKGNKGKSWPTTNPKPVEKTPSPQPESWQAVGAQCLYTEDAQKTSAQFIITFKSYYDSTLTDIQPKDYDRFVQTKVLDEAVELINTKCKLEEFEYARSNTAFVVKPPRVTVLTKPFTPFKQTCIGNQVKAALLLGKPQLDMKFVLAAGVVKCDPADKATTDAVPLPDSQQHDTATNIAATNPTSQQNAGGGDVSPMTPVAQQHAAGGGDVFPMTPVAQQHAAGGDVSPVTPVKTHPDPQQDEQKSSAVEQPKTGNTSPVASQSQQTTSQDTKEEQIDFAKYYAEQGYDIPNGKKEAPIDWNKFYAAEDAAAKAGKKKNSK